MSLVNKILKESNFFLKEKILNIWPSNKELRNKYGQEVFDILQTSYQKIGGIRGNGFNSVEDMINNIPLWKIVKRGDKITAVVMYKDKNGRKRVAAGTDGTRQGKLDWQMLGKDELKTTRSYVEISGAPLSIMAKSGTDLTKIAMPYEEVERFLDDKIRRPANDDEEIFKHPELKKFFYQREINGHWHTKILLGKTNLPLSEY